MITLPDGQKDPEWFNDCGETCVAMVVSAVHGTPISPASVRANIGGPQRPGLTDGVALRDALAFYNVAAHVETVGASAFPSLISHCCANAWPTIVLGTWPTPGKVLHWMLTTSAAGKWSYINPWSGQRSFLAWCAAVGMYAGIVVVADAHLHYDMSDEVLPY
jgi:hypothetical protein